MLELRSKAGESCLGGDLSSMVVLGDEPAVETAGEGGWGRMPKETEGFPILGAFAGGGLPTLGALGRATATGTGVSMHLGSNMKTKTLRHTYGTLTSCFVDRCRFPPLPRGRLQFSQS